MGIETESIDFKWRMKAECVFSKNYKNIGMVAIVMVLINPITDTGIFLHIT